MNWATNKMKFLITIFPCLDLDVHNGRGFNRLYYANNILLYE